MNNTKIDVTYLQHMGHDLITVNAARVSYDTISTLLNERDEKLIAYLGQHYHLGPFEHNTVSLLIECPLVISQQIQRHRTFSYSQVSRRYTAKNITTYTPAVVREQSSSNHQASQGEMKGGLVYFFDAAYAHSLKVYADLIQAGVCREQARFVLPQGMMTKFWMTGNLRNWAHFVKLRIDTDAQGEVREVAEKVSDIITPLYPHSWEVLVNGKTTATE